MKCQPYINIGGTELGNSQRVNGYLRTMNTGEWTVGNCNCTELGTGFTTPTADPAPWYTASYPDSAQFLGVMLDTIEIETPSARTVSGWSGGQRVGPRKWKGRLVHVSGILVARNAQAMAYGKRWVAEVLHAADNGNCEGCGLVDICVLASCSSTDWRTLHNCGLVDGPIWSEENGANGERITRFTAQFASEFSHLHADQRTVIAETQVKAYARVTGSVTVPEWPNDTALQLKLKAGSPSPVTNLTLSVTPGACAQALDDAALLLDAQRYSGSGNWIDASANAFTVTANGGVTFLAERDEGPYIYFPGGAGNHLTSGKTFNYGTTLQNLDVRIYMRMPDWTPSVEMPLLDKQASGDFTCSITTTGTIRVTYTDGTTSTTHTGVVPLGITDGTASWVRIQASVVSAGTDTVRVYKSSDGESWTLMETMTAAGSNFIRNATTTGWYFGRSALANLLVAELYRLIVDVDDGTAYSALGVTLMDLQPRNTIGEPPASIPDGQVGNWTIARAASGYYTQYVDRARWMFDGTNDYFEIADNATLDLTAGQTGSVLFVGRPQAYTNQALVSKKQSHSAADVGWALRTNTTVDFMVSDGTTQVSDTQTAPTAGRLFGLGGTRKGTATKQVGAYVEAVATALTTDTSTGTLANSMALRIGRLSGSGTTYFRGEVYGVAWWTRQLTGQEFRQAASRMMGRALQEGATPCSEWVVAELPADTILTIDGVTGEIRIIEESSGRTRSSLGVFDITASRAPNMPTVGHCLTACVAADAWDATVNADTKFTVFAEDRDL